MSETDNQNRSTGGELTNAQRKHLRGLGHALHPLVQVGARSVEEQGARAGKLKETLVENVEACLLAHEFVEIKVHDSDALAAVAQELCEATGAEVAQTIGKTFLLWRKHPDPKESTITLPSS